MYKKLLIFITIYFFLGCASQSSLYEKAYEKMTVEAFEEFLKKYPEGKYAEAAQERIEELEYEKAEKTNTIKAYKDFLDKYPKSKFDKSARTNIEKLEYNNIKDLGEVDLFKEFIKKYPKSSFTKKAKLELARLEYNQIKKSGNIELYKEFIEKHPKSYFADDARKKIAEIEYSKIKNLDKIELYKEFIEKYPKSYFADNARKKIVEIEYSKIKNLDKIELYKEFIENFPNSEFADSARYKIKKLKFFEVKNENNMNSLIEFYIENLNSFISFEIYDFILKKIEIKNHFLISDLKSEGDSYADYIRIKDLNNIDIGPYLDLENMQMIRFRGNMYHLEIKSIEKEVYYILDEKKWITITHTKPILRIGRINADNTLGDVKLSGPNKVRIHKNPISIPKGNGSIYIFQGNIVLDSIDLKNTFVKEIRTKPNTEVVFMFTNDGFIHIKGEGKIILQNQEIVNLSASVE